MISGRRAPIPNSYWVSEHLIAGEYPGDFELDATREKIALLLEAGVRVFVNLTEEYELPSYEDALKEEAAARGIEAEHVRLSIRDMHAPTRERMSAILDELERHAEAGRCVYVHCWGGVGRTGTVVGCHLVRGGRTGEDALSEVARLFATMSEEKTRYHPRSPETEVQRTMIREWKEGGR